jgi:putative aminopeptidase FrvX
LLDLTEHLKKLVEAHAPSGHEAPIREILREEWAGYVDEFQQDGLGSLIGIKRATKPTEQPRKIMLAAHMDEIGLLVRDIVDGFIYVHRISGVDSRVMLSQPVVVHGKKPLKGIVAAVPPHLLDEQSRKRYPSFDELVIDVGLSHEEVTEIVTIGDTITPDVPLLQLQGSRVAAKAFDDRACVAIVTQCLALLQGMNHSWDVYATATVQEETGLLGATTASRFINPDIAIALDVGFGDQHGAGDHVTGDLGKGGVLGIGPNFHIKLNEQIEEVANKHEIKFQKEVISGASGTDAWAIQVSNGGVPTALLSLPLRSMHSPVETIDLNDVERTARLLAHFIASLSDDFLATIDWDRPQPAEDTE